MNKKMYYILILFAIAGLGITSIFVKNQILRLILSSIFTIGAMILYYLDRKFPIKEDLNVK